MVGDREAPTVVTRPGFTVHGVIALGERPLDDAGEFPFAHGHVALKGKTELVEDVRHVERAAAHDGLAVFTLDVGARVRHFVHVDHHVDEGRADHKGLLLRSERRDNFGEHAHQASPSRNSPRSATMRSAIARKSSPFVSSR